MWKSFTPQEQGTFTEVPLPCRGYPWRRPAATPSSWLINFLVKQLFISENAFQSSVQMSPSSFHLYTLTNSSCRRAVTQRQIRQEPIWTAKGCLRWGTRMSLINPQKLTQVSEESQRPCNLKYDGYRHASWNLHYPRQQYKMNRPRRGFYF